MGLDRINATEVYVNEIFNKIYERVVCPQCETVEDTYDKRVLQLNTPQYIKRYLQGCVCSAPRGTFGCCPANFSGILGIPCYLGLAFGVLSICSGLAILRNSSKAIALLKQVDNTYATRLYHFDEMRQQPHAAALFERQYQVLNMQRHDLRVAIQEQRFHQIVSGALQMVTGSVVALSALNHIGIISLGIVCGVSIASVAGALSTLSFVIYAAAFTYTHLNQYCIDRSIDISKNSKDDLYTKSVKIFVQERKNNAWYTGIAWASATSLSAALGLSASPIIWPLASVAIVWAILQNMNSRYLSHLPVSPPHACADALLDPKQRQKDFEHLQNQNRIIRETVEKLYKNASPYTQFRYHYIEKHFAPKCGAKSFVVLAKHAKNNSICLEAMLNGLHEYCMQERELLYKRYLAEKDRLEHIVTNLHASKNDHQNYIDGFNTAHQTIRHESENLALKATQLQTLDAIIKNATLIKIANDTNILDQEDGKTRKTLGETCLTIYQLTGTLAEILPIRFINKHRTYFKEIATGQDIYPIDNICLNDKFYNAPDNVKHEFYQVCIDYLPKFFNINRLQSEIDQILTHGIRDGQTSYSIPKLGSVAGCCT